MLIEIQKQKQYDGVCVLHCEGSLVPGPEMDYLETKLDEIKRLTCNRLLIDFQNVAAIGSMGITFIVGAYSSVTRRPGGRMVLTGANRFVRRVLDLTQLSTLIPLASDLASGIAMLRAKALADAVRYSMLPGPWI
jgi:anti-anti-sigma factor